MWGEMSKLTLKIIDQIEIECDLKHKVFAYAL